MPNNIVQRIVMEGAELINSTLKTIGQNGERVFANLKSLSDAQNFDKAAEGLGKVREATTQLSQVFGGALIPSVQRFGEALVSTVERSAALATVGTAVGVTLLALAKHAGTAANAVSDQAQAMGVSIETYQKYQAAAAAAGVEQSKFSAGLETLSKGVEAAAQKQKLTAIDLAESLAKIAFPKPGDTTAGALGGTEALGRAAAQVKAVLDSLGENHSIDFIRAKLLEMAQASDDARQKIIQLGDASPANLIDALDRLRDKTTTAGSGIGAVGQALKQLGISVLDSAGNVRQLGDILPEIADKFSEMPDGVKKSALSISLFGKAIGPQLIPLLNGGREGLSGFSSEIARLGLSFDLAQTKIGGDMVSALAKLAFIAEAAKNQLALMFAPIITEGANALTRAILDNFDKIREWAVFLGTQARQVVLDFIAVLSGRTDRVDNQWIVTVRDAVADFSNSIQNVVIPKIRLLVSVLNEVAQVFNTVFGSNLTGGQLLFGAVILQMIGVTSLLTSALRVAGIAAAFIFTNLVRGAVTAALPLIALAGVPGLIIAAFVAAGILIGVFWDDIVAAAKFAYGLLADGAKSTWNDIGNFFRAGWELLKSGWQAIADVAVFVFNAIVAGAKLTWGDIQAAFTAGWEALKAGWAGIVQAAAAAWQSVTSAASSAWEGLVAAWQGILDRIVGAAASLAGAIAAPFEAAVAAIQGVFEGLASTVGGILSTIAGVIDGIISRITSAAAAASNLLSGGSGSSADTSTGGASGSFASGGYTGNLGRSRIAGVVHGNEYVQPAHVVAQPGVLAFLEMLRRTGDLSTTIARFVGGFSMGGMVERVGRSFQQLALPGYAGGGLVQVATGGGGRSNLHPVVLDFGGGKSFGGLFAPPDVVGQLKREAVLEKMTRSGKNFSRGGS